MAKIWITRHALSTGVIEAEVGGLARVSRWYDGRRWAAEDYHTSPEAAFSRVRAMCEELRFIRELVKRERMPVDLNTIEAGLDRGEFPLAKGDPTYARP